MNMPHSLQRILFILSLFYFGSGSYPGLRYVPELSLPVGTQENTDQHPLRLYSGDPDGGTGVRAERIQVNKSSKVQIAKLQEIKMIKNETHVWKIINTGENFFFLFP